MCDFNKMKSNYISTDWNTVELPNFYKWGPGGGCEHSSAAPRKKKKVMNRTEEQNPNCLIISSKVDSSEPDLFPPVFAFVWIQTSWVECAERISGY